jgi:LytS/YehU family sensor histidine kinase
VALPLQIILALSFATLAYPALILGEYSVADHAWHAQLADHGNNPFSDPMVMSLWLASFVSFLPTYGFGLTLVTGLALYSQFRKSEVSRAALEREWSAARLAALRMQLSPHTLFNLLHTIRGLIEWDPKGAQSMVVQLADLLRRLLSAGEREFSRLADELQFVKLYLDLQQRRFTDRLSIALPQADEVPAVWTPSLILQPLVENAVAHGLVGHQGAVTVRLTARVSNGVLKLRVVNTVAQDRPVRQEGIGLKNVRERLAVQFGGRAELSAGVVDGEWVSEISMPELLEMPKGARA